MEDGYNECDKEAGFLTNFTQSERNLIMATNQYTILYKYEYGNISVYGSGCHIYDYHIANVVQNANTAAYKQKFTDKMFLMDVNQVHEVYENESVLGNDYYIGSPTQKCVDNDEITGLQYSE